MNFKTITALYKKEILDIFRDKKTIIIMLVVPLLLYPAIFFFAAQISVSIINEAQEQSYNIVLDFDEGKEDIEKIMNDETDEYDYSFNITDDVTDCETALADKKIDAYVTLDESSGKPVYNIYYISSVSNSSNVVSMINDILLEYRNNLRNEKLEDAGLDAEAILYPVEIQEKDTASSEQSVGYLLGSILPVILVVIIVMSATYPATDITAGEKERGTLETILTLPVTGQEIFTSKFMAVSTIAIFSAFINILSMGIVTGFMYTSIMSYSTEISINISSFIPALLIVICCVIIFAMFISALTMGICASAKSFKEAQNYMTPFTLVIMIIGYVSFIPSIQLTTTTAIVPVLNICLLIKQLLTFEYNFTSIFLVFISNILYAIIAITLLGKMYNSENIMFGESGREIKLFERRANIKSGGTPGTGDAVVILLISIIFMVYSGAVLSVKIGAIYGVIIPQIFFAVICFASSIYLKCDIKKTFSIKKPPILHILSSFIMGIGMICLNLALTSVLSLFMKDSTQDMSASMDIITNGRGFIEILIIVGFLPAICEEILFRGYLYSSVKDKYKPIYAMIIVSLTFGIYHMNLIQSTVTAIIGMTLVIAVYKTNCLFISMIMHCINNSFSVICMYYPDNKIVSTIENTSSVIGIIILAVIGFALFSAGIFIIDYQNKKSVRH